jgi:site-specific DNA recombinase
MNTAAIYARKSTEQNVAEEAKSITRQVQRAQAFAAEGGLVAPEELTFSDDGVSGAEFENRPGLQALLRTLTPRPPFHHLIVMDTSRLGREAWETNYLVKRVLQAGVRLWTYLDGREITVQDKLRHTVTGLVDDEERDRCRRRTADALVHKARQGHVTGGVVFGYRNVEVRTAGGQRSHVERAVNPEEAAVVRRIFEACARGVGFRRIAHELNEAGSPAPRPSKGGPRGWAPSTVRAVLHRELYRGVIVWNRTQKRDAWGQKRPRPRAEGEWVRKEAPDLRIIPEELWQAAHDRLRGSRDTYLRATSGRLWGRPSNGIESKYLLTGMAACGRCGGALTARSRSHGRHRGLFYHCLTNVQRGRAVCDNDLAMPLKDADEAVLTTLEADVLRPEVLTATLREAVAQLNPPQAEREAERERLRGARRRLETELDRLTEALASGGDLPSIVAAVKERQAQRNRVERELAELDDLTEIRSLDLQRIEQILRAKLDDWRGLLSRNVAQARQALRGLIPERLTFTPTRDGADTLYVFEGMAVLNRFLSGIVELPKAVVAPTGFEPVFHVRHALSQWLKEVRCC